MVRGIVFPWAFPLLTRFDYSIDKDKYLEIISMLYNIKFICKLSVCDMSTKNTGLAKTFQITPEKPFLLHPCDEKIKVYFSFDIIHCYKNLVNHIRDDYVKLPSKTVFDISDVQEVVDMRGVAEVSKGWNNATTKIGQVRRQLLQTMN